MNKALVFLCYFIVAITVSAAAAQCPFNEEWSSCSNPCNTCDQDVSCIQACTPGCDCRPGLTRNGFGECVLPPLCDAACIQEERCPPNEQPTDCVSPCLTCELRGRCPGRPPPCRPGCDCRPGYFREASTGECVPAALCTSEQRAKCPAANSAFLSCGPGCEPSCEDPEPEPELCSDECTLGCYCLPGFYRTHEGSCVPPQHCEYPRGGECKADEQYYEDCPPRCNTCENHASKRRGRTGGPYCACGPPGCFCAEGLLLRADGRCVQPQHCSSGTTPELPPPPPKCPEYAEFQICGNPCPPTCENRNPVGPCKLKCIPECHCKPGYLRLRDRCVPQDQCGVPQDLPPPPPSPKCPEYAEFQVCGNPCPPTCENRNPVGPCKLKCIPECHCKPGYLRLRDRCVPEDQCDTRGERETPPPLKCPKYAEFQVCGNPCPPTCENRNPVGPCNQKCIPECHCKTGYLKKMLPEERCVPEDQCDDQGPRDTLQPQCTENAHFLACGPACPETCENRQPRPCTEQCIPGCFCKRGYLKLKNKCVPAAQCETKKLTTVPQLSQACPAENEVFIPCGPRCSPTCEEKRPPPCTGRCVSACFCKPGYLRNKEGKCVHVEDCSPKAKCPPDEHFYASKPDCKNTCENYNNPGVRCIPGQPGCFCKEGLVKRQDGKCVTPQECPAKCPPEEQYYASIPDCKNTCQNFDNPGVKCIPGPPGCFCRLGLVKRQDGKCVNPRECSAICPPDQQYYASIPDCKNTCENVNNPGVRCPIPGPTGCFCRQGLVKRIDGKCVSLIECPVKCLANEQYYESIPDCKNTCENYDNQRLRCNPGPPGCFCRRGLVKRQDGRCVGPQECPAKCLPDEQYYASIPNCKNTCENFNNPGVRCPIPGPPGCFCRLGLVKRQDGKCVNPLECSVICPPDEQYYASIPNCKNTCGNINNTGVRCPTPGGPPGCFCREGLVKRNDGKCVSPRECPATCRPDEQYYEHIPDCKNTCKNFNNPGVLCRTGPPGCFCKEGLVKGADGKCVTPAECPVPQCERHEQYYASVLSCKNTCENYQDPRTQCLPGPPGCFCREGLVKRKDGRCVLPRRCRRRCPPYEQFYTHMPDCKNTCENFANPETVCQPGRPGCFCRKGLVKRNDGRCVKPLRCPVSTTPAPAACQENAVFVPCGSGCPPTCEDRNPRGCVERCVAGCFCKPGFLRTKDNRCVLPEQCGPKPPDLKCPENSVYLSCGPSCPVTCEERTQRQCATKRCVPGCFCLSGYLKNREGRCVVPEQCGPPPTPRCKLPDEVFLECGPTCPDTCDNRDLVKPPRCNRCDPGCFCKTGLLRSTEGACISSDRCPQPPTPSGYHH